jgi:hypothetical protein
MAMAWSLLTITVVLTLAIGVFIFVVGRAANTLEVVGNISCSVITASSHTGITSSGYVATGSLATGSFTVIESNGIPFLYYRTYNGTLRSASLN